MDSGHARGCCSQKDLEINNDNTDRISNYFSQCGKLDSFNWLREISDDIDIPEVVEVRFKNTRKEYFANVNGLRIKRGDFIAVEASPGHDIGTVSLAGELYSEEFYSQIYRVLRHGGKLFHYTGNPHVIKTGSSFVDGVIRRLKAVGFKNVQKVDHLMGVSAHK